MDELFHEEVKHFGVDLHMGTQKMDLSHYSFQRRFSTSLHVQDGCYQPYAYV